VGDGEKPTKNRKKTRTKGGLGKEGYEVREDISEDGERGGEFFLDRWEYGGLEFVSKSIGRGNWTREKKEEVV